MAASGMRTRYLLGLQIAVTRRAEAISVIQDRYSLNKQTLVVFANTNLLSLLESYCFRNEISQKCIVLNDGLGVDIISILSGEKRFPENLNGTDFTNDLLRALGEKTRIFCFGSKEGVVNTAAAELARLYSLAVAGSVDGFVSNSYMNSDLVDSINSSCSDVILVGLGNPRQEEWMLKNADRLQARVIVCVGAFFDFTAGAVYRAPPWARRLRLEWLFRLFQEPTRLWRRYSVDPIRLALKAARERFKRKCLSS